jgi:hypothetical protein
MSSATETTTAFIQALLRALVRWCLKRGVRSAQVEEVVRRTFVEEAQREISEAKGEFSVSKVSVMTGLHRSEVARLLAGEERKASQHDVLNRVIGLWASSKKYRTSKGATRALTFEGLQSEFAALVADVSKEVTHYPILFELERIGAIEYDGNMVKLVVQGYTPQGDVQYGLDLLTHDVMDLVSVVESNVLQKIPEPSLHLRTSFDNIDPQQLREIRQWVQSKGAEFHAVIRDYLAARDRDVITEPQVSEEHETATVPRAQVSVTSFALAETIQEAKVIMPKKRGRKRCS